MNTSVRLPLLVVRVDRWIEVFGVGDAMSEKHAPGGGFYPSTPFPPRSGKRQRVRVVRDLPVAK